MGLRSLFPSLPYLALWCRAKISSYSHPTTFLRWGKLTWGEVRRGGAKLLSLTNSQRVKELGSSVINCNYFSLYILSSNWGDRILAGQRRKLLSLTNFLSCPSLQSNTHKISFLSIFISFIFYPPYFTPNQTTLKL